MFHIIVRTYAKVWRPIGVEMSQFGKVDHCQYLLSSPINYTLTNLAEHLEGVPFRTVLMDSWYASQKLMALIDQLGKIYYCPLKRNRLVDDSGGQLPYRRLDHLEWAESELTTGKLIKIRNFPANKKVKLFRVTVSSHRTDFVVTNDQTQDSTQATRDICGVRWMIEVVHRELKQLTGIESCQCRKGRIQRNHIHCALLVWDFLRRQARERSSSLYQVAYQPLSDFLRQQLAHPSLAFAFA